MKSVISKEQEEGHVKAFRIYEYSVLGFGFLAILAVISFRWIA